METDLNLNDKVIPIEWSLDIHDLSFPFSVYGQPFTHFSPHVEQPHSPKSSATISSTLNLMNTKKQFHPPSLPIDTYGISPDDFNKLVPFESRTEWGPLKTLNSSLYGGIEGLCYLLKTDVEKGLPSKRIPRSDIEEQKEQVSNLLKPHKDGKIHMNTIKKQIAKTKSQISLRRASEMELSVDVPTSIFPLDFVERGTFFGLNKIDPPKTPSIVRMVFQKIQDDAIIKVLLVSAILIGILGTLINPEKGWLEAVAIITAVTIVSSVAAYNDYSKEMKFKKLMMLQTDKHVKVIRGGILEQVSSWEIVVGDLVELTMGDEVPADGVYVRGTRMVVDESPLTGETIPVKKNSGSPFMFSGCQVAEGNCTMLVTAVGARSTSGQIQKLLSDRQNETTPLQNKLSVLGSLIGKFGLIAGILNFLVLSIKWGLKLRNGGFSGSDWKPATLEFLDHFTIGLTVVVVAVPEGLPLSVTMALAFSMFKMIKDQCFVRSLMSSETMGEATCICTDKTGTLTENRMTVVRLATNNVIYKFDDEFKASNMQVDLLNLLAEGVAMNSTCFLKYEGDRPIFVGSATEGSLLVLLRKLGRDYDELRHCISTVPNCQWDFDSTRKRSSIFIIPYYSDFSTPTPTYRLHVKGASEIILSNCVAEISGGRVMALDGMRKSYFQDIIQTWASEGLRTIALAYKNVLELPAEVERENPVTFESNLILLAIVGIKDPVRAEVPEAVRECQRAGLKIRMVTGDNMLTASKIATECGILTDGIVLEGPQFARMSEEERLKIIPNLQVLARSSPADKYTLVKLLKDSGEVVAVTGDGTNDAPALKVADVGFAMGKSGTQIAINASDIILLDDNFASLVRSIKWGRNVLNCVRKFLQFQLSINFSSVIITFIGPLISSESIFKSAQLLWINLIMDSLGALALATDPPHHDILKEPPHPRFAGIVSLHMYQHIFIQTSFQLTIFMTMLYSLEPIIKRYRVTYPDNITEHINTMIANTYVLMSVTNQLMSRQLHHEINIFKDLLQNKLFLMIECVIIAIQILIMEAGTDLFGFQRLNWQDWLVCSLIAFSAVPFTVASRCVIWIIRRIHYWRVSRKKVDVEFLDDVVDLENVKEKDGKNGRVVSSVFSNRSMAIQAW